MDKQIGRFTFFAWRYSWWRFRCHRVMYHTSRKYVAWVGPWILSVQIENKGKP